MSDTTNAALIAEARKRESLAAVHLPGQEAPTLATRLADALEAAEVEMSGMVDQHKLIRVEAEHDAALAVIERAAVDINDMTRPWHRVFQRTLATLRTAPADALAELKRVTAEKAWDACLDEIEQFEINTEQARDGNPYRANPEPKEP